MAPSQRGKRPLLLDISNNITLSPVLSQAQQAKKKVCRNVKTVQIPEHKAVALSADDIQATQEIISEHVGIYIYLEVYVIYYQPYMKIILNF